MGGGRLDDIVLRIAEEAGARSVVALGPGGAALAVAGCPTEAELVMLRLAGKAAAKRAPQAVHWESASGTGDVFAVVHDRVSYTVLFDDAGALRRVVGVTLRAIGRDPGPPMPPPDRRGGGGSGSGPAHDELGLPRVPVRRPSRTGDLPASVTMRRRPGAP